jgi:nitrite reductase/ring-hydroxylating ferredoxin subunit
VGIMAEQEVVTAGAAAALAEGGVVVVELAGIEVLVTRSDGAVYALDNECSHRGCNLSDGEVSSNEIACPCHGAIFDLRTGAVLDGPAPTAQRTYAVREVSGTLEVIAG